ncbi:response regulator [Spongiivirga citrea]|uniref:Response regulator n=1 Tax=Spongiivirga citrea TaxID=1481457 RepID=A0A6M0CGW2_9FLAO|nr:response regulator [Spongiivirga citrea]NER17158.1 response regulator [Spongiivirga citrea]
MSQTKPGLTCIIDDDNLYLKIVSRIIESKDLCKEIVIFKNGKEAIDHFSSIVQQPEAKRVPDVIFLDLNMPVMDGWEFLEEFLKINADVRKRITLYVVSSSIDPRDINRAKSFDTVEDYLVKPLSIDALKKVFSFEDE